MGPPWRFDDRGWFVQDAINLRHPANLATVEAALQESNVLFGCHRWFAGGSTADPIAIASMSAWMEELDRGEPGDNIIAVSLREARQQALVRFGDRTSGARPTAADLDQIEQCRRRGEVVVVQVHASDPASVSCSATWVFHPDDEAEDWADERAWLSGLAGEFVVFDGDVDWTDHRWRSFEGPAPETWTMRNGLAIVDGFVPDAEGRVVCSGPY